MATELKLCPFCGGQAELRYKCAVTSNGQRICYRCGAPLDKYQPHCKECGAAIDWTVTRRLEAKAERAAKRAAKKEAEKQNDTRIKDTAGIL